MTLSAKLTYVGMAPDRINAMVGTGGIAATGTSLPLTNTVGTTGTLSSGGASYQVTILDGVNTETVACTGNLTGGAIAIDATTYAHSEFIYCFFQLIASPGPVTYIPLETFDPDDTIDQLYDSTSRGSRVVEVSVSQGMRAGVIPIAGPIFPDTFPFLLGGHFGAVDTAGPSPAYTYAFSVNNNASVEGEPVRVIFYVYDAYNTRVYAGRIQEIQITADPKKLLMHSTKVQTRASGVVANPNKSYSTVKPLPSWSGVTTIGGTVVGTPLTFEATFTATESEDIPTMIGIQDPWDNWLGPEQVKGKWVMRMDDDTQYNNYVNASIPAVDVKWTIGTGASTVGLEIHMADCNYDKATPKMQGKGYVTQEIPFTAVANATDATTAGTGLSPAKVTVTNATSSGNYC